MVSFLSRASRGAGQAKVKPPAGSRWRVGGVCDDVELWTTAARRRLSKPFADAAVACMAVLSVADMGHGVFDLDALAELGAADGVCWR